MSQEIPHRHIAKILPLVLYFTDFTSLLLHMLKLLHKAINKMKDKIPILTFRHDVELDFRTSRFF